MLMIKGICKGVKGKPITPKDPRKDPFTMYTLGIADKVSDGFDDEEVITHITIWDDLVQAGMVEHFQSQKGKAVSVPVTASVKTWNNENVIQFALSPEILKKTS